MDPLVCTRCGQKMQMIGFLTDQLTIRKILDHLGLDNPAQGKPPPEREILRFSTSELLSPTWSRIFPMDRYAVESAVDERGSGR